MRMLMNNLDPDVAERPDDLVVYGGAGKAARDWAVVRRHRAPRCARLKDDETLLVQSGKPVGVFQTHEYAPRVLIANANLVPDWATWDEFRRLDALGLTMYGQMTAGCWIYIGTQGILQGTYQTFAAAAEKHYGAGSTWPAAWCSPPAWAAWAAPSRWPSPWRAAWRCAWRSTRRASSAAWRRATSTCPPTRWTRRCAWPTRPCRPSGALSIGLLGNAADVYPELVRRGITPDLVTDQTSAHDTLNGYVPNGMSLEAAAGAAAQRPGRVRAPRHGGRRRARAGHGGAAGRRGPHLRLRQQHPRRGQGGRLRRRLRLPGLRARSTSGRCSAAATGPSAGRRSRGDPADIAVTDARPAGGLPGQRAGEPLAAHGAGEGALPGPARRICWLEYGERAKAGLIFNELVRNGKVKAPIVIGRDHLDSGSVASPYRETEAMRDGSDAIADWPILNAMLNAVSGASWVSFHHGGGVGIGKSLHAGMVVVADGTERWTTACAACSPPTRARASCVTPTPATRRPCRPPASSASTCRWCRRVDDARWPQP